MKVEIREQRIAMMNGLYHAVALLTHNSKGEFVHPADVVKLAKKLAVISLAPGLEEVGE